MQSPNLPRSLHRSDTAQEALDTTDSLRLPAADADALGAESTAAVAAQGFLGYIHNFRAIAILFVIAGHCLDPFDWSGHPQGFAYSKLCLNGSHLFVFISGYLFQHLLPKYRVRKYLKTKLECVVLPYVLWSTPPVLLLAFFGVGSGLRPQLAHHSPLANAAMLYLTGAHLAPYWFIPMICVFYLVSPLLARADRHDAFYWLLPLYVAVSLVVPRGGSTLQSFAHFFSVYVFGMLCSHYKGAIFERTTLAWVAAVSAALVLITLVGPELSEPLGWANFVQKMLACVVLVIVLQRTEAFIGNWLHDLAAASFGLYFVHAWTLPVVRLLVAGRMGGTLPFQVDVVSYLVLFVNVTAVSMVVVIAIKWLGPRYSRRLVGA